MARKKSYDMVTLVTASFLLFVATDSIRRDRQHTDYVPFTHTLTCLATRLDGKKLAHSHPFRAMPFYLLPETSTNWQGQ